MRITLLTAACVALMGCNTATAPAATDTTSPAPATDAPARDAPANDAPAAPADTTTPAPTPPADDATPAASDPKTVLSGTTWRVTSRSDGGAAGDSYAFKEDGTLVIDSPNGTPMTGTWQVSDDGALSMTEEGVTYPTDLTVNADDRITLRSHNPGGTLTLELVRAP